MEENRIVMERRDASREAVRQRGQRTPSRLCLEGPLPLLYRILMLRPHDISSGSLPNPMCWHQRARVSETRIICFFSALNARPPILNLNNSEMMRLNKTSHNQFPIIFTFTLIPPSTIPAHKRMEKGEQYTKQLLGC